MVYWNPLGFDTTSKPHPINIDTPLKKTIYEFNFLMLQHRILPWRVALICAECLNILSEWPTHFR